MTFRTNIVAVLLLVPSLPTSSLISIPNGMNSSRAGDVQLLADLLPGSESSRVTDTFPLSVGITNVTANQQALVATQLGPILSNNTQYHQRGVLWHVQVEASTTSSATDDGTTVVSITRVPGHPTQNCSVSYSACGYTSSLPLIRHKQWWYYFADTKYADDAAESSSAMTNATRKELFSVYATNGTATRLVYRSSSFFDPSAFVQFQDRLFFVARVVEDADESSTATNRYGKEALFVLGDGDENDFIADLERAFYVGGWVDSSKIHVLHDRLYFISVMENNGSVHPYSYTLWSIEDANQPQSSAKRHLPASGFWPIRHGGSSTTADIVSTYTSSSSSGDNMVWAIDHNTGMFTLLSNEQFVPGVLEPFLSDGETTIVVIKIGFFPVEGRDTEDTVFSRSGIALSDGNQTSILYPFLERQGNLSHVEFGRPINGSVQVFFSTDYPHSSVSLWRIDERLHRMNDDETSSDSARVSVTLVHEFLPEATSPSRLYGAKSLSVSSLEDGRVIFFLSPPRLEEIFELWISSLATGPELLHTFNCSNVERVYLQPTLTVLNERTVLIGGCDNTHGAELWTVSLTVPIPTKATIPDVLEQAGPSEVEVENTTPPPMTPAPGPIEVDQTTMPPSMTPGPREVDEKASQSSMSKGTSVPNRLRSLLCPVFPILFFMAS